MYALFWIFSIYVCVYADIWENNVATNKSYFLANDLVQWSAAEASCAAKGSKLAVIANEDDTNYIVPLKPEQNTYFYWIGLLRGNRTCSCANDDESADCEECRKSWKWIDGHEMDYLQWALDRPLGGSRACGLIKQGFRVWDATSCTTSRKYMCQHDCHPGPCRRNRCNMGDNGYECMCTDGYTGQHCDKDIDECLYELCKNGAVCLDGVNKYICECAAGYTGSHCETDIDECQSATCQNSGACIDMINGFECECKSGFTGRFCESVIDECTSMPCLNNGTCVNLIGRFYCQCPLNITGAYCENDSMEVEHSCDNSESCNNDCIAGIVATTVVTIAFTILSIVIHIAIWVKCNRTRAINLKDTGKRTSNEMPNTGVDAGEIQLYETMQNESVQYENSYETLSH